MFEVFKDKRILITGNTGFKGTWLTMWLLSVGAKITGYALDPQTSKDVYTLCKIKERINEYIADIRNYEMLKRVNETEKPEFIFHLAAQPLVIESYHNPLYTIETNTQGTANILEVFRKSRTARVLIVVTTDKVYQNKEWLWGYRENDRLGGEDPYSASKAASEILFNAYRNLILINKNKKALATVRAGNVIGGGDWSNYRIIPDCIKAIESNKKIELRNPYSIRPWQHVLEPLRGYLMLAKQLYFKKPIYEGAWNFGPLAENNITVEELVKKLISEYGSGNYSNIKIKKEYRETGLLELNINKARKLLKWNPILNIDETIKFTSEWYKNYKEEDVYELTRRQIMKYIELWKSKS